MGVQTLFGRDVDGSLPDKYLCLTIDDGPSACSRMLAEQLFELDVPATFFLNYDSEHWSSVDAYWQWGHVVANHTHDHQSLTRTRRHQLPEYVEEFQRLLDPYFGWGDGGRYIRAPYGEWNAGVADRLRCSALLAGLVGHIGWEYDTRDWASWRNLPGPVCSKEAVSRRVRQELSGLARSAANHLGFGALEMLRWLGSVRHPDLSSFTKAAVPQVALEREFHAVLNGLEAAMGYKNWRGGIVLMHENNRDDKVPKTVFEEVTVPFAVALVNHCRGLGYRFVGLDCCQGVRNIQSQLGRNARPEGCFFGIVRGARVHWHRVCVANSCFLERTPADDQVFWRTGKDHRVWLKRQAKEIAGRHDGFGHIHLLVLDAHHKIWHQAFCKGDSPTPKAWRELARDAVGLSELVLRNERLSVRYKCQRGSYRELHFD
jgi:hypothetical protein